MRSTLALLLSLFAAVTAFQGAEPGAPQAAQRSPQEAAAARELDAGPGKRPRAAQDSGEEDTGPTYAALQELTDFAQMLERDKRVSFGARTHAAALQEFERRQPSESGQSAALVALGCARIVNERARLESFAREGPAALRQAAILALGELRVADVGLLIELSGKRAAVAEFALFALVRNGGATARATVAAIAAQEAHPLNAAARDALGFALVPPVESVVARHFLDLRFDAARRFGLVDEQAWTTLLVDDLTRNQKFLSRVVYRAAAGLVRGGVKDHFLEVALAGGAPERLRGVVRAMPTELSRMVEEELFKPADDREWVTLVDEIRARGLQSLCQPILRRAWFEAPTRTSAMALLARAQSPGAMELVALALRGADAAGRATAAQALAYAPAETALPMLELAARDEVASVRAAALVAQFRLGSESAAATLREQLEIDETTRVLGELLANKAPRGGGDGAERGAGGGARGARTRPNDSAGAPQTPASRPQTGDAEKREMARLAPLPLGAIELLEALAPACEDRRVRDLLAIARSRTPTALRLRIDSELAFHGDARSRVALREALRENRPSGSSGARAIEALAHGYGLYDLELLRELFPLGDDVDVDAELALALIGARDAAVLPVLRAALWSEPWNRSVLAAALLAAQGGIEALRAELVRPPAGVGERDLRRVGFALGEWGGAIEVDRLAARVGAADPALQGALLGALSARTR